MSIRDDASKPGQPSPEAQDTINSLTERHSDLIIMSSSAAKLAERTVCPPVAAIFDENEFNGPIHRVYRAIEEGRENRRNPVFVGLPTSRQSARKPYIVFEIRNIDGEYIFHILSYAPSEKQALRLALLSLFPSKDP
jgi:hypothetical protein